MTLLVFLLLVLKTITCISRILHIYIHWVGLLHFLYITSFITRSNGQIQPAIEIERKIVYTPRFVFQKSWRKEHLRRRIDERQGITIREIPWVDEISIKIPSFKKSSRRGTLGSTYPGLIFTFRWYFKVYWHWKSTGMEISGKVLVSSFFPIFPF